MKISFNFLSRDALKNKRKSLKSVRSSPSLSPEQVGDFLEFASLSVLETMVTSTNVEGEISKQGYRQQ